MAKSKKGGVFGYLRGKVGDVSFSILSAKRSSSGKKEQIVRALPDSVENPNTIGQIMQRMKVKPASKFYAALETILSNAFEGVSYGDASRRYFMKKAMEMVGGPYIPKGVDRFIPAEYIMSEGSLPSFPLVRSQASDADLHTSLTVAYEGGGTYTPQALADALGVSVNTQISVIIVNNENGVFVPHFAGFDERITIADLPASALVINDQPQYGNAAIRVANLGISGLTMTNWVAACVILSIQDASGSWLRSTQNMVLNTQMYADLYSSDAENAAIASYQDTTANNAMTNPWYLNLGMNQAFDGRIIVGVPSNMPLPVENAFARNCAIGEYGVQEGDYTRIERCVFATDTTDDGLIIIVDGGIAKTDTSLTVSAYRTAVGANAYTVKVWRSGYAAQAGLTWQGESTPEPTPGVTLYVSEIGGVDYVVDAEGKLAFVTVGGNDQAITVTGADEYGIDNLPSQSVDMMDSAIFVVDEISEGEVTYGAYTISIDENDVISFSPTLENLPENNSTGNDDDDDLPNTGG